MQTGLHVAFACDNRELVDAFHAAAIAAGGTDNGPAGPRPIYHPHYYGAFVLDLDGNNIEAVCHRPGIGALWAAKPSIASGAYDPARERWFCERRRPRGPGHGRGGGHADALIAAQGAAPGLRPGDGRLAGDRRARRGGRADRGHRLRRP